MADYYHISIMTNADTDVSMAIVTFTSSSGAKPEHIATVRDCPGSFAALAEAEAAIAKHRETHV